MNEIILELLSKVKKDKNIERNSKYYIRALANIVLLDWDEKQLNRNYSSYENAYSRASVLVYRAIRDEIS